MGKQLTGLVDNKYLRFATVSRISFLSRRIAFVLPSPYIGEMKTPKIPRRQYAKSSSRLVLTALSPPEALLNSKAGKGVSAKCGDGDARNFVYLPL